MAADGVSALVTAGVTYTMGESGGPAGYTPDRAWTCTGGGIFTDPNKIVLAPDEDVTCTIVNRRNFQPLTVDKTVTASFHRTYLWTIAKNVGQTSVTAAPGGNAIFHYTVTATPNGFQDSNWAMTGTITVTNANPVSVPVTVTDLTAGLGGGATCTVAGSSGTVPANDSATFGYSCTFTNQPNYTGGTNTATATWTRNGGGSASSTAKPVTFALGTETNKTIHVQDNKTAGTFVELGTATWTDPPTSLEYDLALAAGGVGTCNAYTNTARVEETSQQAQQTVNVCVPNVTLAKTVSATRGGTLVGGTGTPLLPGDVLTWTATVNNSSTVAYSGALFSDDLSSTVAGATLAGGPDFVSSDPSVATSFDAATNTLSATATNLAAGASVSVTYSGTVRSRAELSAAGVTTIDNTVVPRDQLSSCVLAPGCDTTNPLAPHLTLVKNVVSGSTGPASSPDWTLTATGGGATPINGPGITNTTGPNADVTGGSTYALTEAATDPASTVTDGYTTDGAWSCVNANAASTMTATAASVTPADGADITCTITNTYRPVATATKTVSSTAENVDGSWTITYHLVVTNPDRGLAATYSLSDTPGFGAGITITGAAVTTPVGTAGPAWDGSGTDILATDRPLVAGATETWTIALTATVAGDASPVDTSCNPRGTPGFGFFNTATITTPSGVEGTSACSQPAPREWSLSKAPDPVSGTTVEPGGQILYTLAATNTSPAVVVTGAKATDTLPADVTLVTPLPVGLTDNGDGTLTWAIPDMPPQSSVSISYQVTVDDSAAGKDLTNVVVPTTPGGVCTAASDCTTTHHVPAIILTVANSCRQDAAYLSYSFSTKNVPNASSLPVTVTWRTQDGTVARVDTIPAGQTSGSLLWPDIILNADGIAIGWPGWRSLEPSDFPLKPGVSIYGTQITDPSLPSFAFRQPMTVTFEISPEATATVDYPGVTPAGCTVPREPNLEITKTASVSAVQAGGSFTYNINMRNTSTLGVAYPVTLSDPIPANLNVTGITTAATGFPHWQNCAVNGTDADGFGGTLDCDLSAALGVSASAPAITLEVTVRSSTPNGTITNKATTCWDNPSIPLEAQKCAEGLVPLTVTGTPSSALPNTDVAATLPNTGVAATQMGWLALLLLLGGGLLLTTKTIWRRKPRRH